MTGALSGATLSRQNGDYLHVTEPPASLPTKHESIATAKLRARALALIVMPPAAPAIELTGLAPMRQQYGLGNS
jgi:hypothetical protein